MSISLTELTEAVQGGAVGVRLRIPLEPLGGPGDKVAPPTYGIVADGALTRYAEETRRIGGENVRCVLLDSVASQANRQEATLLDGVRAGDLSLPLVSTNFGDIEGLADLDRISSLQAPHRIFDAILRDSLLGNDLFRMSLLGQAITEATPGNAAALFRYSPTTLVFGGWDSTGPRGGRGSKYERALTSEIVGIGAVPGVRAASRIDPLAIEKEAGPVYESKDGSWTLDETDALIQKGTPVLVTGGDGPAGRPSQVNHSNFPPSIDTRSGGVTVDRIEAITVLSFIQLRRLLFPTNGAGSSFGDRRYAAESAARAALAALALAAVTLTFEAGFDLRSRCVLVPTADLEFELISRGTTGSTSFTLTREEALQLVADAANAAAEAGLPWETEEILLTPAPRLVDLIKRSRNLTEAVGVE